MAKKSDADEGNDDLSQAMSAESLEFLEQVRKGKPRYFVMGIKGSSVSALILKKKPIKEGDKKDVRGGGYQAVFGVATGSGTNVTFIVARADGFNEAPGGGKTEKLKKFLSEQTGKTLKADWQVADSAPNVPDEDQPNDTSGSNTPPAATPQADQVTQNSNPQTTDDSAAAKLLAKLKALTPQIQAAVTNHPDRRNDLLSATSETKKRLEANQVNEGTAEFKKLAQLLQELSGASKNEVRDEDDYELENLFPDDEEEEDEAGEVAEGTEIPDPPPPPEYTEAELSEPLPEPPGKKSVGIGGRMRWEEAKEMVDANLSKLQTVLREQDDADFKAIAEYGFNGITGKLQVGLRVALMEYERSAEENRDATREKALAIIKNYQSFLESDPLVALVDDNIFAVEVDCRGILGKALRELEATLRAEA